MPFMLVTFFHKVAEINPIAENTKEALTSACITTNKSIRIIQLQG
jgi:hypothetical protein